MIHNFNTKLQNFKNSTFSSLYHCLKVLLNSKPDIQTKAGKSQEDLVDYFKYL